MLVDRGFLDVAKDNEAYSFTTRWQVAARCEDVSDALEDTDRISRWWPSVYRECTILERGGEHGLGRHVAVTTKGFLPYLIRWEFTVVEEHYPYGSRIVATGDLEGEGRWTLRPIDGGCAVTYEWTIRANHAFIDGSPGCCVPCSASTTIGRCSRASAVFAAS